MIYNHMLIEVLLLTSMFNPSMTRAILTQGITINDGYILMVLILIYVDHTVVLILTCVDQTVVLILTLCRSNDV